MDNYVDAAAIGGRNMPYQGRSWNRFGFQYTKKSTEAIVVVDYELRTDTAEALQINEGLNIKMFQMPLGSPAGRRE